MKVKLIILALLLIVGAGGAIVVLRNSQGKNQYIVRNKEAQEPLSSEKRYVREEADPYIPPEPKNEREPLPVPVPIVEPEPEPVVIVEVPPAPEPEPEPEPAPLLPLPSPEKVVEIIEKKDPVYPLEISFTGNAKSVGGQIKSDLWAPSHRLIECRLVSTIETRNTESPVIALTTSDLVHHGQVIIPANTELHGVVSGERSGDRVQTSQTWNVVFGPGPNNGKEMKITGLVLHRAADDKDIKKELSAGFKGRLYERDPEELKKLFGYTAIREGYDLAKESIIDNGSDNVNISGDSADAPIDRWLDRQFSRLGNDPYYLHVAGGTAFYLYTLEPIDVANAVTGAVELDQAANNTPADLINQAYQQIQSQLPQSITRPPLTR